jgi:hypothetical protein
MPSADALNSVRNTKEKPVEVLNGGYVKYKDPASGHFYYFNAETQESTYDRPAAFIQTVADPFAAARDEGIMPAPEILSSARSAAQTPDEILDSGWQKFVDPESGHPYYWNSNTDESTYDRPEGFQTNNNPFQSARGSARQTLPPASLVSSRRSSNEVGEKLNGGWVKYIDPESQTPYYHHAENDESQWEKPSNFVTSYNPFGTVKSRRRTGSMLPKMSENATLSDDILATGGSSMDALDNAMMATFNKGALDALSETSPLKSKASAAVPSLSLGGGGGRKSSIGRSGKTVLSSANDVLAKVNAKLANMSMDEMREKSEGDGLMSTLRKTVDTGRSSGKNTNREGVVIPTLSLGGVGARGAADSLDVALAQSSSGANQSWDAIADANESVTDYSSVLASGDDENNGDAANAWVEYFDEEVGAKCEFEGEGRCLCAIWKVLRGGELGVRGGSLGIRIVKWSPVEWLHDLAYLLLSPPPTHTLNTTKTTTMKSQVKLAGSTRQHCNDRCYYIKSRSSYCVVPSVAPLFLFLFTPPVYSSPCNLTLSHIFNFGK